MSNLEALVEFIEEYQELPETIIVDGNEIEIKYFLNKHQIDKINSALMCCDGWTYQQIKWVLEEC